MERKDAHFAMLLMLRMVLHYRPHFLTFPFLYFVTFPKYSYAFHLCNLKRTNYLPLISWISTPILSPRLSTLLSVIGLEEKEATSIPISPPSYLQILNGHFAPLLCAFPGLRIRRAPEKAISDRKYGELTAACALSSPHSSNVTAESKNYVLYLHNCSICM